jgi:cysteinyl-tRNA synthetase
MSSLKLYNTLTKQKEEFNPIDAGKVSMYTCGPTVYGYQHIGNYKSFMTADILYRYLTYGPNPYEVKYIQNITDVGHLTEDDLNQGDSGEDKMIKKATAENKTPEEIAQYFTSYHLEKSDELNLSTPLRYPRATQYIDKMILMIENLIEKGHAYVSNGNVFYDVESFPDYGKLSGNTVENLQTGARLEDPHVDKRNQWDFALWLTAPKEHLMQWDSPWGSGYPGWHIECSAMATEELDTTIDIHTGGEDHIFPHHEAEIAQSEGATNKPFANYWLHTRHMMIEGKKMSKSKGTLLTIEDIKAKGFTPMDLRMTYLLSHYRSQMNFTWESLEQARSNRKTLDRFKSRLETYTPSTQQISTIDFLDIASKFDRAMDDDLNTPEALAHILTLVTSANTSMDAGDIVDVKSVLSLFDRFAVHIFGLILADSDDSIPASIHKIADERKNARDNKDFAASDRLRDEIAAAGYAIEDTPDGYTLSKV